MTEEQTSSETTDTAETKDINILFGLTAQVREGETEPYFEIIGDPSPPTILALAREMCTRLESINSDWQARQHAQLIDKIKALDEKLTKGTAATEGILALLGKVVAQSDSRNHCSCDHNDSDSE